MPKVFSKVIGIIFMITLFSGMISGCADKPTNHIELDNSSLNAKYMRITEFQTVDDVMYFVNDSMAIHYIGMNDNSINGVIVNPNHTIISNFQTEDNWVYFWASSNELCRVNLLDHDDKTLFQIDEIENRGVQFSWIIFDAKLYYIQNDNEKGYSDLINIFDFQNMTASNISCSAQKEIIQVYDKYLYVRSYTSGGLIVKRIDLLSGKVEEVAETLANVYIRGDYLISCDYVESDTGKDYSLRIQQLNGTRNSLVTKALYNSSSFFPAEDALYFIDEKGVARKMDYATYRKTQLFKIDNLNSDLFFPLSWDYPAAKQIIHYKTGETLSINVPDKGNVSLQQYADNYIEEFEKLPLDSDIFLEDATFKPDGKFVIIRSNITESGNIDAELFEMDDEHYKVLMDHDVLATSISETHYIVIARDGKEYAGVYSDMSGGSAIQAVGYNQIIRYYIFDAETYELVYSSIIIGKDPAPVITQQDLPSPDQIGDYPMDAFIDKLLELWHICS